MQGNQLDMVIEYSNYARLIPLWQKYRSRRQNHPYTEVV